MSGLFWIVGLLLLIWSYSNVWQKQTAGKIGYGLRVAESKLSEGDEAEIWTVLENRSWFPLPWVELNQPLPDGIVVEEEEGEPMSYIVFRTYLLPRQRMQRRHLVRCTARGEHRFEKAGLKFGDGIGLKDQTEEAFVHASVLVRPRLLDKRELGLRMEELMGERTVQRWYQEDPSRLLGVRSYMQGDPFKAIHWAATARTGDLMVKQFETTSETDIYVVINAQFFEPFWSGFIGPILEHEFRLAATLFHEAAEQGFTYGLYSNATTAGVGALHVPLDNRASQLDLLMTVLGQLPQRSSIPFEDLLRDLRGRLARGTTLYILTGHWSPAVAQEIELLRTEGLNIVLIAYDRILPRLTNVSPSIRILPVPIDDAEEEERPNAADGGSVAERQRPPGKEATA